MTKEYEIIDPWNLKNRKKLDKDGIELLKEKILWDVDRAIDGNIKLHRQKIKKGTFLREDFVITLLDHLREDLRKMIGWRFTGDD